jgi:hypothetical protein
MKKIYLLLIATILLINLSFAQWTTSGNNVYLNSGNAGIGTTNPTSKLAITGNSSSYTGADLSISRTSSLSGVGNSPVLQFNDLATGYGSIIQSYLGQLQFFSVTGGSWSESMRILGNGNVGIGTKTPMGLLSLNNQIPNTNNSNNPINYVATHGVSGQAILNSYYVLNPDGSGPYPRYLDIASVGQPDGTNGGSNIRFLTNAVAYDSPVIERMRISASGNVLIGKTSQANTGYILDVAGNVRANQIVVNSTGADFVFATSYRLNSLSFLKKYINQNHHLPEIPSAKQMQAEGLNVGDNQVKLLQKVEELTLYLIEKDKQLTEEQAKNVELEKKIHALETKLNTQEGQIESILKQLSK